MGQQQSQLNQETRNLGQRLSQQMRLSAGDQDQVRRLAERQRELRQQLEQIQKDDQTKHELLGRLDAAKRDMEDAEEALREGSVGGDLEQKQERILSRLLDAQRSVNRRDYDPKRESRPGEDIARASAPELPADMLRETDRLRLDMLKAESDRYPAQYRAYIEAYLRSLNQQRAGDRR
jgi:septal ring factor EnvC (AmiA/AmiB activator)